jgi:hypothetical protein
MESQPAKKDEVFFYSFVGGRGQGFKEQSFGRLLFFLQIEN